MNTKALNRLIITPVTHVQFHSFVHGGIVFAEEQNKRTNINKLKTKTNATGKIVEKSTNLTPRQNKKQQQQQRTKILEKKDGTTTVAP